MGQTVDANGRSILHKGHGATHTCAPPDVCKTPSPGGPVPIPYVNIATDSNLTDGAESVKIEGNPLANVSSKISMSSGDEAGTAGGILSSKFKGAVTWKMGSLDVKAEGKSVVRFLDSSFHNGNSFNSSFIDEGGTGVAYADDFDEPCPICREDADKHKILETINSAVLCAKIVADLISEFNNADLAGRQRYAKYYKKKKQFKGYMVGVMVCKEEHPLSFAAMSGTYSLPGFREVAARYVDVVLNTGNPGDTARAANVNDFITANTSAVNPANIAAAINARWNITSGSTGSEPGYAPMMGICAGAHLVARSGHGPAQMTEMYFAPRNPPFTAQYPWRVNGVGPDILRNFTSDPAVALGYPWGLSVASCKTCQELLFLTMCPERVCTN